MNNHYRVIIIGSGPAGYTAGIYTARANLSPLIITGTQVGGQLTTTTEIENFPGFEEGIKGPELMLKMKNQAERFGAKILMNYVSQVDLKETPYKVYVGEDVYTCDSLIIATGASAKWLGLKSETEYKNKGVSGCATCDGFFFKDKKVAVIGGGDTAMEEALYLTNFCEKVVLIHRREEFRASQIMLKRAQKNEKIEFMVNKTVDEFVGDSKKLTAIKLKDTKTNKIITENFDGAFVAIGHKPNTEIFADFLNLDEKSYIKTKPDSTKTNKEGVFACGDVKDSYFRQGVVSAGSGCMAAIEVERFLV
jgi:thioredoxin reductase (NADPH)